MCQLKSERNMVESSLLIALATVGGVVVPVVVVIALLSCFGPDCLKVSGRQSTAKSFNFFT